VLRPNDGAAARCLARWSLSRAKRGRNLSTSDSIWCPRSRPARVPWSVLPPLQSSIDEQRVIGGVAPSDLAKLEKGDGKTPPIDPTRLDIYLASHLIDPSLLRADDFDAFMADRQKRLLELIERATGKAAYSGDQPEEGEDVEGDEDTIEAELTLSE
jgi:hypothetical protein